MSKLLMFGPMVPPYTGQSIAFTTLINNISDPKIIINTTKFQSIVINSIYSILHTFITFASKRFSTIYFTSSRSRSGFIKDMPLIFLGKLTGKRIVNHLHGADFKDFYTKSGILKPIVRYCYNQINTSIVLTESMKDQFSDFPKMNVVLVKNCYSKEFDIYENMPIKKQKQLLFLSNIICSKGIFEFLQASEHLLENNSDLRIKIAGKFMSDHLMSESEIRTRFESHYNRLLSKFDNRIEFKGTINGEEKIKLFYESSIFILPTYYPTEAFPISIIEAMRTGNAIITTNHNYLPEIVNHNNGIIIMSKSYIQIINAVERLFSDSRKLTLTQQNNRRIALESYSEEKYISKIKDTIFNP